MLTSKFNPCANLLYHWLLIHHQDNQGITFEAKAFQIWSGEFLPRTVTQDEIIEAIMTLKRLKIITCHNHQFFLLVKPEEINQQVNQLPLYHSPELKNYGRDNNGWYWSLVFLASLLTLWGSCFWLSLRIAQTAPSSIIPPTPFHVLADK